MNWLKAKNDAGTARLNSIKQNNNNDINLKQVFQINVPLLRNGQKRRI
jgi:hypothetical protein